MKRQVVNKLPSSPGVYFFKRGKAILYIGKATNLRDRVRSYFSKDIIHTRGPLILKMLEEATSVSSIKTDSVLEALILEASQIKKYQPIYNTKEKSDKSFNYVVVTKEDFPRVLIMRERVIHEPDYKFVAGPFPRGNELKEALRIVRKIFPFRDRCMPMQGKACFNHQLGLCPGVCAGIISKKDYRKIIRHLILFFEGKKGVLVKSLEKEMKILAKARKFEEAERAKRTIFALNHIRDVSLLKNETGHSRDKAGVRIEAYDIAHISGKDTVGVMTVVEDGEVNKNEYRKFKIRLDKNNDIANLHEVLSRRLKHEEWQSPNLIVVDGGIAQINVAKEVFKNIDIVSIVKDDSHKPKDFLGPKSIINKYKRDILLANSEAHRFAITYHRKLRGRKFVV